MLSLREDDYLSLLSSELKRLDIGIAALSEVQRPDCGEIMVGGETYYWSGRSDGYHSQGVAVALSNKLTPMIIDVTLVHERIIRLRIRHTNGPTLPPKEENTKMVQKFFWGFFKT